MADWVLGIDLGTSGVKVGLLDLASCKLEHVTLRAYDSSPQQDTGMLFEMTIDALRESICAIDSRARIRCIGLSGQMHGAVLYDQAGEIIHPLINWQDREFSHDLVVEKAKDIIGPAGSQDAGINLASGLTGAILFGIKENDPDLFSRIKKFVLPTDFIRARLLGRMDHATDQTNAFSTGLFNTRASSWHHDMIKALGLPLKIFPEVHRTIDIAGTLCPDIADRLNLKAAIPIIIGGGDNQISMLGSGLLSQSSPVLLNIGTASQISMVAADYVRVPGVDTRSFFEGNYAFVGASLAGGGSYQWLKDQIQDQQGVALTYAEMDQLAARVPPGAQGLRFSPGPSRQNPERLMGFYGNLAYQPSVGHRARAVMEAVVLDLFDLYRPIRSFNASEIMLGAGKALQKSRLWSQIAADIFQKPVHISGFENALYGAAVLAAVAVGALKDPSDGINAITYDRRVKPSQKGAAHYHQYFMPDRS